ncbi:hypothetical protein EX895_005822 [Sporisorium graminicola]|uniref:RING-type domain-containing protein n=1 Tax=Sporisorium graminicola TaxID=280036 RepID=A0A4U7KP66_9BASI|nr:hypothetical protein EX895_005822 [Sporisorium graminicola]TKY84742.1 hypothetical protein EX895_005822 [Sporisorium graminicola]
MPPPSRRQDRNQAAAPANRSRMYNLAGHAHSSGSLLPRSTDVHVASTSGAVTPGRAVDAADAPYLTNLESHFGRVTLTAPDNLLRKQAKEKKQKTRQRKAQNAQLAAAALAAAPSSSTSNLLDSSRRYQTTLDDAPVSTGLLVPPSAQITGMRRAYSGGHTPTLASTSQSQASTPSASQTIVARTRRRRPSSAARDDTSRPASRASGVSRPESALSLNDTDLAQAAAITSNLSQPSGDQRLPRSRTESAPASQRRSHNAFDTAPANPALDASARPDAATSATAPQTSLHRQNVWNDITEADPDDLPPPFPVGATRPPTPPLPPTHSEAANDAQLIGPQPHARIPDSPPPAFVSDDEDEALSAAAELPSPRLSVSSPLPEQSVPQPTQEAGPSNSRSASRASTPSSASVSDDESFELTEERRAWEADIRNGLSFEVRLLREQQRRLARERASALQIASIEQEAEVQAEPTERRQEQAAAAEPGVISAEQASQLTGAAVENEAAHMAEAVASFSVEAGEGERTVSRRVTPVTDGTSQADQVSDEHLASIQSDAEQPRAQTIADAPQEEEAPVSSVRISPPSDDQQDKPDDEIVADQAIEANADGATSTLSLPEERQSLVQTAAHEPDTSGRLVLANEPRLGLPRMPSQSRPTSSSINNISRPSSSSSRRISGHRKTNSDTQTPVQPKVGPSGLGNNGRASLSGFPVRRLIQGQAARGHDSDLHLPLSRRPEDTLYVISAPPPATYAKSSSDEEAGASRADVDASPLQGDHKGTDGEEVSDNDARPDREDDDGAESDSSIEQWLAESAAFDALRKREEEAAARMQALREPLDSDSDEADDAAMPGAFGHRASSRHRQASSGSRKVPDPANLALMDRALPRAPPPLVLGRSRGGAAYSDSSSESTDTDDALDLYSSSDEEDEQHRAFYDARAADSKQNDLFANSHKSVHARTTSSAPNLTTVDEPEEQTSSRGNVVVAPAAASRISGNVPNAQAVSIHTPQPLGAQTSTSELPRRSLSLKAQGKLPERVAEPAVIPPDERAGDFEADTSSSRDLSDEDPPTADSKYVPESVRKNVNAAPRNSMSSHLRPEIAIPRSAEPAPVDVRRSSLDPLLQPLAYGQIGRNNELRDRLKGLFGQPLVVGAASQPTNATNTFDAATLPSSTTVQAGRFLNDSRHVSDNNLQSARVPPAVEGQLDSNAAAKSDALAAAKTGAVKQDDAVSITTAPTLHRHPSTGSGTITDKSASPEATTPSSSATRLPEQRARDEALLQIAQLSASTQSRQDSLAALERLLAKTGRPTSLLPPSTITRAELGGRLQLTSDVAATDSQRSTEGGFTNSKEQSSTSPVPTLPASNRLSRQGAIVRGRGPLPSPPSALSRGASTASRPVSFVNPRSSAAPLPRGRLPAITDATRHFPPSSSTGPGVAPSWLSYIPSEERERLPAPLEPQRAHSMSASRAPPGKVSAMISRFEAAPTPSRDQQDSGSLSSPTKESGGVASSTPGADSTRSSATHSIEPGTIEREGPGKTEQRSEPAVFRRFSRTDGNEAFGERSPTQRRPPPPPPTLPVRRPNTNPFRPSQSAERPSTSTSSLTQSNSMEALARQIEEAAFEWTEASLHDHGDGLHNRHQAPPASRLTVPVSSTTASSSAWPRSPRTQAMHTLTRREHDDGATTPPSLPPKSPLMTPEQILASGSRNGLSASIAAAQAAAFARRDGRESRTHSASSSMDTVSREASSSSRPKWTQRVEEEGDAADAASKGPRPLPTLPSSLRSYYGLGINDERGEGEAAGASRRELPVPPPLPTRPRNRDWDSLSSASGVARSPAALEASSASSMTTAQTSSAGPARSISTTSFSEPTDHVVRDATSPTAGASARDHPLPETPVAGNAAPPAEPLASASSSTTSTPAPRREASLGVTDFDLLVAQLERQGSHFESLSAIGEFLGPAKPAAATAEQLASLSVGLIECDSRRMTREGKIKQKLSCVGVRVDKCAICLAQFREAQRAVILPCGHIFHEECTIGLLRRITTCPTCRAPAV